MITLRGSPSPAGKVPGTCCGYMNNCDIVTSNTCLLTVSIFPPLFKGLKYPSGGKSDRLENARKSERLASWWKSAVLGIGVHSRSRKAAVVAILACKMGRSGGNESEFVSAPACFESESNNNGLECYLPK